ncbi:MAG: type II toxin-antitoxin system RelE/ParE family toxin [Caldilinea sp. CFX5]|nr:type II toxin-antitoxin system RelE/ParE family toxin [Caldilinea sp. CFX5]
MYQLRIPKPVRRRIDALPGRYRQRVWRLIQSLASNPRPAGAKQLREREQMYRIALDDYRIVYSIEDDLLIIEVVKVGSKAGPEFYQDV